MVLSKKSQSKIIVVSLLILIAFVIAGLLLTFAIPFVENIIEESQCTQVVGAYEITNNPLYNCYDVASQQLIVQVHRAEVKQNPGGFTLEIGSDGSSNTYSLIEGAVTENVLLFNNTPVISLPTVNGEMTYRVNSLISRPHVLRVYPILNEKTCETFYETLVINECPVPCEDKDIDGYPSTTCGGNDCNDNNNTINPARTDICGNGIDEDCSGSDLVCPVVAPFCGDLICNNAETCNTCSIDCGTCVNSSYPYVAVKIDGNGNIIAGAGEGAINSFYLIKFHPNGSMIKNKTIQPTISNVLWDIALDNTNNVYFTGGVRPFTGFPANAQDLYTAKYNSSLDFVWQRQYHDRQDDLGLALYVDNAGVVYSVGRSANVSGVNSVVLLYNSTNSSIMSTKKERISETFIDVKTDTSRNVYILSMKGNSDGVNNNTCALYKYDLNWNALWNTTFSVGTSGGCYALYADNSQVYITSSINKLVNGIDDWDFNIKKYLSDGTFVWSATKNMSATDTPYAVTSDNNQNVYVTGSYSKGRNYAVVIKYDTNGNELWTKDIVDGEEGRDIIHYQDNLYIAGMRFLHKYTTNGTIVW